MSIGTSIRQDKAFLDLISDQIGTGFLEIVLEYVANNFQPDEIFNEDILENWARANDFVKE